MNAKNKERATNIIINIVVSASLVFFGFKLSANWTDEKDIQQKFDSKLDKTEFQVYKDETNERFVREAMTTEKFLEQLDEKFKQQTDAIDTRIQDLKDYIKQQSK